MQVPKVTVYYNPKCFLEEIDDLGEVLEELVPGALNTEKGRLTPGSIELFAFRRGVHDRASNDVLVDIEACYYDDRAPAEKRAETIQRALSGLFPNNTFAVWLKLVNAGWASDVHDPDFDGDLSFKAALERAMSRLKEVRTTS
jgi:hypothetical protein